jgi:hypothetical protein
MQETLNNCLSLVESFIEEKKLVISESVYNWEHIPYNGKDERHYEIVAKNGKSTKQWLHVFIYRHETCRYELNMYTL